MRRIIYLLLLQLAILFSELITNSRTTEDKKENFLRWEQAFRALGEF